MTAALLAGCGGDVRYQAPATVEPAVAQGIGLLEVDINFDGKAQPASGVRWLGPGDGTSGERKSALAARALALNTVANGLDMKLQSTSAVDVGTRGVNGMRYLSATYLVRNAAVCSTPGSCTPYAVARSNLTFIATATANTVSQTAVSRFLRFDGSAANAALAPAMLPTHGMGVTGTQVDDTRASLVTFREAELPAVPSGATSLMPYGFVVTNASNNGRTLAASPATDQFDGVVTFAFKIPLQSSATDDPFKISILLYAVEDSRTRVAQSSEEASFAGDLAATARATALGGEDLATLGGRLSQTPIGNPICTVRVAGTAASPTAYLANNVDASPRVRSAPTALNAVAPNRSVSVGACANLNVPTASSFVVHGSHSGPRVAGGAYGGSLQGGGSSDRPNQLVWALGSGDRPFFRGETVHFSATAGNSSAAGTALSAFVGTYQVAGSIAGSTGGFGTPSSTSTGSNTGPVAQAVVDLNGDGHLDLVVAKFFASKLDVYLGNGDGTFGTPTSFDLGSTPEAVVLGDLDGDGKLDVVVALMNANAIGIRMGNGSGGFGAQTNITVSSEPRALALGDLNGDGKLDIVVGNQGNGTVGVLLNNGSGGFPSTPTYYNAGSGTTGVVVGDFNLDGVLDIATANFYGSSLSVLLGNGNGTFGSATNYSTGSTPRGIAVGDLNGDGKLDLVTADLGGNTVSVFLGTGTGTFGTPTQVSLGSGAGPRGVVIGDFNGDGKPDVAVANVTAGTVSVLLGNGSGGLTVSSTLTTGTGAYFLAFGDLNEDGRLDLVVSNFDAATFSIAKGQ